MPDTGSRRFLGNRPRALGLHGLELLAAALMEDADQIDDGIGACDGARDRGAIPHIGGDGCHLPDDARGLQEQRLVRTAHRHPHRPVVTGQIRHHVAADES